eukprot:196037-Hanusia_phi.AAC.1
MSGLSSPGTGCEERWLLGVSSGALRPWLPRLFFALCVCVRARSSDLLVCFVLRLSGLRPSFVVWY